MNRVEHYESAVLRSAKSAYVAFSNFRAKHDLCIGMVKQNVSGCYGNCTFAEAHCQISSPWPTKDAITWWPVRVH